MQSASTVKRKAYERLHQLAKGKTYLEVINDPEMVSLQMKVCEGMEEEGEEEWEDINEILAREKW